MHITEFQQMMKTLYFNRDSERGIKGTFEWLREEIDELGEALERTDKEAHRQGVCRRYCLVIISGQFEGC